MNEEPSPPSDRECLVAWRRSRAVQSLEPLVQRYAAFVYASAHRRTEGDDVQAAEITRAVFLVLARRAAKLSRKTVLAGWLFTITNLAVRKTQRSRLWPWGWFAHRKANPGPVDASPWARIAPGFDRALNRLPRRLREAFLLDHVLGLPMPETAVLLRASKARARKRAQGALKSLARRFRKVSGAGADRDAFAREVAEHACRPAPEGLVTNLSTAIGEALSRRPRQALARRVLNSLALKRWRRRLVLGSVGAVVLGAIAIATALHIDSRTGFSRFIALFLEFRVRLDAYLVPGLTAPAKPWPTDAQTPRLDAARARSAADVYRTTNIWLAHLSLSRAAWDALQPKRIAPLPHFLPADGALLLRNPKAQRSGLAGVLGFDFDWTRADFEFGGVSFTNVAARLKGNGTHLMSLYGDKRAFKVDLNKYVKGQKLAGGTGFTFNNLVVDRSYLSDALAYEFFRDAGVPAPRTAFAYVNVSVAGKWDHKPLGLYVIVEPVDARFAADRFGSRKVAIFKPVTYEFFEYLGDDWSAYAAIYDAKTETTPAQRQRVIEFARLVSNASDAEFTARVAEFLDLEAFARFLAGQVILANYDSLLLDGQNFYLYVDPKSQKFGFIPWDLDSSWGAFPMWTVKQRERASIWHPWVGGNRFLERVLAVEEFRKLYRACLEDDLARLFVRERLFRRIDELAALVRPAVAAESDFRLQRFDLAVSDHWPEPPPRDDLGWADRPVYQIKRFIEKRASSVRQQLDGKTRGMILERPPRDG